MLDHAKPIIISGIFRTATSITSKVIDSHPEICATCEQNLLSIWRNLLNEKTGICNGQEIRKQGKRSPFGIHPPHVEENKHLVNIGMRLAYKSGYKRKARKRNKDLKNLKYYGDKWIPAVMHKGWVESKLPGVKFIVTTRNRRDTIASVYHAWFCKSHPIERWINHYDKKMIKINEMRNHDNVFIVEYDRMQNDKEALWQEVADWLSIDNKFNLDLIKKTEPRQIPDNVEKLIKDTEDKNVT